MRRSPSHSSVKTRHSDVDCADATPAAADTRMRPTNTQEQAYEAALAAIAHPAPRET